MMRRILAAIALVALGGALMWGWQQRTPAIDPAATLQAAIQRMEPQARLVTTTAFVQVVSRVEDLNRVWGDARVFAIAPGKIHYSVDLSGLTAEGFAFDAASRTLAVTVPDPTWTVEPDMKRLELIRAIGGLRTEGGIGNVLEAQVLQRVGRDMEALARTPDALATARAQAREGVRALLEPVLAATGQPVRVQVRFASETGARD